MLLVAMALGAGMGSVAGQEGSPSTPAVEDPSQDPVVTPTPVVGSTSGQLQAPPAEATAEPATTPEASTAQTTGPVAAGAGSDTGVPVLAQGLVYLTGDDIVWQVREVELSGNETVKGNARVVLQRSGASVIRNDVTGKRTRIEQGEAYFAAAGDPYTTFADGGSSVVWIFELGNSNSVGEGAFYLSPDVPGYAEATYDVEFARNTLGAGETANFEGGSGPSLLMVLSGNVNVTAESGEASLTAKDGLVVTSSATVASTGGEAVYVTMTVGPEVSDASAAAPQAATTGNDTDEQITGNAPTQSSDPGAVEDASTDTASDGASQATTSADGAYVTSIQVGAVDSVGVTMYVDGELVFDGWLEPGQWTDFYTGTSFEVYTTSGVSTQFQNTCGGDPFVMGFEEGEAYYYLEASASSCAPTG
jgi:hypothetical protein